MEKREIKSGTKKIALGKIKRIEVSIMNPVTGNITRKELRGEELREYLKEKGIPETEVKKELLDNQ